MPERIPATHLDREAAPDLPECFGRAERVCPRDGEGFIQPQAACVSCEYVRRCIQTALGTDAAKPVRPGPAAADPKIMRFLKRWSAKKRAAAEGLGD